MQLSDKKDHRLGAFRLSGLMIGPILGSGIVLLPPIAADALQTSAIWAWVLILGLGGIFAWLFADLTIQYPGDGGMTIAVEKKLGQQAKFGTSLLLLSAVSFGPTAVMLTAAGYIRPWFVQLNPQLKLLTQNTSVAEVSIALLLVVLAHVLLKRPLKWISTFSLVCSIGIGILLTYGAGVWLLNKGLVVTVPHMADVGHFGKTAMFLFWAIIGWEIVGNYAMSVKSLEKTIPQATLMSLIAVTWIYLIVALAVQSAPGKGFERLIAVLSFSYGHAVTGVLALLVTGLCFSTYLLIVGAVTRLMRDLSREAWLPKPLSETKGETPINALYFYTTMHIIVLTLNWLGYIDLSDLLTVANGFFLANALIGLWAASGIVSSRWLVWGARLLMAMIVILLGFTSYVVWGLLVIIAVVSFYVTKQRKRKIEKRGECQWDSH